jgi:cytochrome c oxidase assembly protein subunit 15
LKRTFGRLGRHSDIRWSIKNVDRRHACSTEFSAWPFRVCVALLCVTFPLIWVGGLVTTYAAGMAVPDWPNTYGYNLFLYPWTTWVLGPYDLFIEHGHRLLGALAGFVTIGLIVVAWKYDARPWFRWCSVAAFVLVCLQGILGGARVLLDERGLAMVHACVGPVFFAYAVALAVMTSRGWRAAATVTSDQGRRLNRLALVTTALIYLQLVVGARVRHIPVDASPSDFRVAVMFHVVLALVVLGHVLLLAWRAWRWRAPRSIRVATAALGLVFLLQPALGVATWLVKYGWPFALSEWAPAAGMTVVARSLPQALVVTAHVAVASLLLAISTVALVCSLRTYRSSIQNQALSLAAAGRWRVLS